MHVPEIPASDSDCTPQQTADLIEFVRQQCGADIVNAVCAGSMSLTDAARTKAPQLGLTLWDTFQVHWNRARASDRKRFRREIADLLGLVEPPTNGVKTLFPDISEEKRLQGRMRPTESEFETFYAAFPRRVNKAKSREAFTKAFVRLRKDHSVEQALTVILNGVAAYAKHADPDVLCHPTTWLNGSRWEDEPESIGKGKANGKAARARSDYGVFDPNEPIDEKDLW